MKQNQESTNLTNQKSGNVTDNQRQKDIRTIAKKCVIEKYDKALKELAK